LFGRYWPYRCCSRLARLAELFREFSRKGVQHFAPRDSIEGRREEIMERRSFHPLIQRLLQRVAPHGAVASDSELLQRFASQREESAFETIVWRHGPLVLGVCERLLHDTQAAEDAFQATFLVLVRKGASIHRQQSLGSWLFKVAYRIAL